MTKKQKENKKESEAIIEGKSEIELEALQNEINSEMNSEVIGFTDNEWLVDIKVDSLKKALEAGVILPNFRPYKNTV